MDRSFLSDEAVISVSRRFVCARLLTYESAAEAEVLKSYFVGRSGQLENTTFVLLSPDGKTKLSRAGRSPDFAFRGDAGETPAEEMAGSMSQIALHYEKTDAGTLDPTALPATKTVRVGLDVASCDERPLVVVYGDDAAKRSVLADRVAAAAWSGPSIGRFVYAVAASADELKPIDGVTAKAGVLVVEPDTYGVKGKILAQTGGDADAAKIAAAMADALTKHRVATKDPRTHIEEGRQLGIKWKTVIPETDPGPPGGGPPAGGGR